VSTLLDNPQPNGVDPRPPAGISSELDKVERQQSGSGVILIGRMLFNRADYNPDLQGQAGTEKYERMRRDPAIAGHLTRWKAQLMAASCGFEAPKKGNKKAIDIMMDLCNRYILGEGRQYTQNTLKGGLLPHILLKYDFGCSAIEKVWGVNEKGQQVYARLAPILPQSIFEFEIGPYGECARIVQYAYTDRGFKKQLIPDPVLTPDATADDKIAVFTYRKEGDNYFGRPVLRELYQAWFHKSELWTLDGMQKERSGMGLTVIKIPGTITDTNSPEYRAAQKVAFEMRGHERNGAVIGEDWDLEQKYPTGTEPNILGSIELCNRAIAHAFNDQQSQYGNTPNGTKGLGEVETNVSQIGNQASADEIEEEINTQLVRILCFRNVGPQPEYPRFQFEDLDKMSGTQKAQNVKLLMDAKAMRPDRKLEEHLREVNDLPEIDDSTREDYAPSLPPQITTSDGEGGGAGSGGEDGSKPNPAPSEKQSPAKPAAKASTATPAAVPAGPFWREPYKHEEHVAMKEISAFIDEEPNRVWQRVIAPFRAQQIQRLSRSAAESSDAALARGDFGGSPGKRPLEQRMTDELYTALLNVYLRGRRDVADELARQKKVSAPAKADTTDTGDDEGDSTQPTGSQLAWVKTLAAGFVASQLFAMVLRAKEAGQSARNANLSRAAVEEKVMDALKELSVPLLQAKLAGAIMRTYTNGRVEQGKAMSDQIQTVFYSSLLDTATCQPCRGMDGAQLDMDTLDSQVPNPNCYGEDYCRCVPVFVSREAALPLAA